MQGEVCLADSSEEVLKVLARIGEQRGEGTSLLRRVVITENRLRIFPGGKEGRHPSALLSDIGEENPLV